MPVLDLIKMTPVVPGAKTHLVDRERSGVLYFGKVSVVLAADDPMDFDLLIEAEKVVVQENVQHGEEGSGGCAAGNLGLVSGGIDDVYRIGRQVIMDADLSDLALHFPSAGL